MVNFGIKEDKALDSLRKDVKSVIIYEDEKKKFHCFYNENGDRTLRIHYDDNESIRLKQKSTFQEGLQTGYINYDKYDDRTSSGQYELNYSGQIISKYHDGELQEEYQYNELGQIKVIQYSNTGGREIYEYDHSNLATNQLRLQGENSMFGGPKNKLTTFENDSFGNIIEMKVIDVDTLKLMFTQKNKINKQGDEIECLNLNGDGSTYSEIFYDYDYDKKQNWIVKKTLDKDGNLKREQKRNILYYSEQDFSFTKGEIVKDWNYKSKRLNGQRLALLFMALSKNLFQKPKKGQVFYEPEGDGSCTLYFSNEYYTVLKKSIDNANNSGKFSQSNAESDWNDLKYAIDEAEISNKENIEDLELYNIYDE